MSRSGIDATCWYFNHFIIKCFNEFNMARAGTERGDGPPPCEKNEYVIDQSSWT
jgi:hypothetical protein